MPEVKEEVIGFLSSFFKDFQVLVNSIHRRNSKVETDFFQGWGVVIYVQVILYKLEDIFLSFCEMH